MTRRERCFFALGATVAFTYHALHHGSWIHDALAFWFVGLAFAALAWVAARAMQEADDFERRLRQREFERERLARIYRLPTEQGR